MKRQDEEKPRQWFAELNRRVRHGDKLRIYQRPAEGVDAGDFIDGTLFFPILSEDKLGAGVWSSF